MSYRGVRRSALVSMICILAVSVAAPDGSCETVTIGVGESKTVGNEGLIVGFREILADSRCPVGALCFWEGDAIALIWARLPGVDEKYFQLHTHRAFQWRAEYGHYEISLVEVAPYPVLERPTDPETYEVTLDILNTLAPARPTTWGMIKALFEP